MFGETGLVLRIRWEIRDDMHEAFVTPAASVICRRRLVH
jgi:hypothetical protein